MKFVVQAKEAPAKRRRKYPYVRLVPDNWDDYGYKTSFGVWLHVSAADVLELGTVKIMKTDQRGGYTKMPKGPFEALGDDYCSLGQRMDFYEELLKRGQRVYTAVLTGLRDAAFDDNVRSDFENSEGFQISLTRSFKERKNLDPRTTGSTSCSEPASRRTPIGSISPYKKAGGTEPKPQKPAQPAPPPPPPVVTSP